MEKELTPLMKQFWEIKSQHQDKVLLFRMGDFYEMFYDDARVAAPILNIALTSRNKNAKDETPMCGVPHHSIAGPIGKLLAAGHKVAICDQLEDPETAKGIVKRGVTRVLSPGLVYDPESLLATQNNYLAAFDETTVSFLEASTGEAFFYKVSEPTLRRQLLERLAPTEIILSKVQARAWAAEGFYTTEHDGLEENWPERFQSAPESAKRLLSYAVGMQGPTLLSALLAFQERWLENQMRLSANVLKHLEVFTSYRGEERGSLFYAINRTKTSAGARLLKNWMQFPYTQAEMIRERHDQVEKWSGKPADLKILRQTLGGMGDIERRLAKLSYNNCHVRDLLALSQSLRVGITVSPFCEKMTSATLEVLQGLVHKIDQTIVEDPPLNMKQGGYIRRGISVELDEWINLAENGQSQLLEMEAREREKSGISSLKIRYNNVFGYYIEVTNTHKDKVPDHYKRKQTLANAERYVTQELHELESKILSSRERRLQLEERIFQDLRSDVLRQGTRLLESALLWSELDVISGLAWLALEQKYVRPTWGVNFQITGGRHPVVEQEVKRTFVPNDLNLVSGGCLLLTGPNMAGKSTIMRQVAVISLLAQMGSFVPARAAVLPLLKQIYTRIGASDSLSEGLSTFMVEMKETAEMLAAADPATLVVLDEVGRGTSTYDGMSLAQAILEYLVRQAKSYTLFATHYHELTTLAEVFPQIQNAHMSVQDKGSDIQFLYTLKSGPANKSYGIQVAKLAGLPATVVDRARDLLKTHERAARTEVDLFSFAAGKSTDTAQSDVAVSKSAGADMDPKVLQLLEQIKNIKTLEVTPLQALNQIAQWQQELS